VAAATPSETRPFKVKPRLKHFASRVVDGRVILEQEPGVETTLEDPDGQVLALLQLADGTRTTEELAAAMGRRWSDLSPDDVAEGIAALDDAGLLEDEAAPTDLSAWQRERYFSNLAFFGTFANLGQHRYQFQERLCHSRVVLLGLGGLGSMLLMNLAGLGVGHVTVVEYDVIELKNLARQLVYSERQIGSPKLGHAVARAEALNSAMEIRAVEGRVEGPRDVASLVVGADLVLSLIDQPYDVPFWVNRACVEAGVPFITGGILPTRGIYYSVDPGRSGCLGCLPGGKGVEGQAVDQVSLTAPAPRVNSAIGPTASLMGALVGLEAVRYLTGFAPPIAAARQWLVDFRSGETTVGYSWPRVPDCPLCGGSHLAMAGAIPGVGGLLP
jgi:molybdopterin/thiamine biosynthesis adenylyltransferase